MLQTVEGIYEDGHVRLAELPPHLGRVRVIVTFLTAEEPRPTPPDFTTKELADLRAKTSAWDEDWNAPGMEAYDGLSAR